MPKLSRILNKACKTINLAKPNSYQIPRKPPLNSLVFEKLPEPRCGDKITCGIKGPPISKPVRVCTKEDMQSFYCPIPCDCKIKPPPLTFGEKLRLLYKQAMKALFVYGLCYYTYQEGLWSDAFKSTCFLGKFLENCPIDSDDSNENEFASLDSLDFSDPEPCAPFIPRAGYLLYKIGYVWNQVIIFIFWLIMDAPFEMAEAFLELFKTKPKPIPPRTCPSA